MEEIAYTALIETEDINFTATFDAVVTIGAGEQPYDVEYGGEEFQQ